jgi:metal-responsive CopG/Arc/MetJ family transcriptional regulator
MIRTQVYLSATEREGLAALSRRTGRSRSDLIRDAVQRYLSDGRAGDRHRVFESKAGVWAHRTDPPEHARLRSEWDRFEEE